MSDLQKMFEREFTDENQAHLLRTVEAGLRCLETQMPTNLRRDGLAADDFGMELMFGQKAEMTWLADVKPEFANLYLEWVVANRKRIDAVLCRL